MSQKIKLLSSKSFTMLKSIIIFALLCGFALSMERTLESANISVMKLLHSRNLFVAKLNQHLFSLTWKNETHLEVFSTNQTEATQIEMNKTATVEKCTFDARESPFKEVNSSKILNTAVLYGSNVVSAVGFRQHLSDENDTFNRYDYYDLFLFDLVNCNHKTIEREHLNKVPVTYQEYEPRLIAYNDSFDVFFIGKEECTPCRYNSKGEKIEVEHKLEINFDEQFSSFHVQLLDPVDIERNYFYVHNFQNGTAAMKLLDQNFDVVKQRYVNYRIDFLSTNKDVGAPIGICYFSNGDHDMFCERLDFYLNPVLQPFRVPVPFDNIILNTTVTLDTLGNTFVGVLHAPLHSQQRQLAVFRYDLHGQLAEALDFGHVDNGGTEFSTDHIVQIESYIVEGMQGQYCIVVYEVQDATTDHHNMHVKCFQAPKDDQMIQ